MSVEAGNTSYTDSASDRGARLLGIVTYYHRRQDGQELLRYLRRWWSLGELAGLLHRSDAPLRSQLGLEDAAISATAAYCLGLIGGSTAVWPLIRALRHGDGLVVQAAEDALWHVWLTAGGPGDRQRLRRASELIESSRYGAAVAVLDDIIESSPGFAEAYHQRAMAKSLAGDVVDAIADCKRAVERDPCHFGALACMGHGHVHLGQLREALTCYRAALKLHPRMEGIRQSIEELQRRGPSIDRGLRLAREEPLSV